MTFIPLKSSKDLVAEAEALISFVSVEEALVMQDTGDADFVDLRVYRELEKTGVIPGAHSCPRGLLEFWLDPDSPYAHELFRRETTFIFYCDNGWRSALATRLAQEMGLQNVHCLRGGLEGWMAAHGAVNPYHW